MPPRMGPGRACRAKRHKEEVTRKTKAEKQKRKLQAEAEAEAEFMVFSHSDSTTPTPKNHSESWECPLSARRHLMPNSMMIPSRRASLGSGKRLIETGITSMSRCSQPQKLSEHSTATDVIQQLHDPVGTTISPCQVLEGCLVASPSRQVAHPFTLAPEMGHEETEKGGNSVAPENFTTDMPEILVGSPSFSLKLTEMVNMCHDEDDDEVNSVSQCSPRVTIDGYQLKPQSMPILRKIFNKHGNIVEKCTASTVKVRSMLLEMICDIISELQEKDFLTIKEDVLRNNMDLVNEIKNMEVDIEWLRLRLDEILEAKQIFQQSGTLKEEREINRKTIETAESELKEYEEQKKEVAAKIRSICDREMVWKEALDRAKDESTRITETIKYAKAKVWRFLNCSMEDGLL